MFGPGNNTQVAPAALSAVVVNPNPLASPVQVCSQPIQVIGVQDSTPLAWSNDGL